MLNVAALQGFSSAARPLQKALDELLGAGKVTGEPLDGSVLRSALAQEKTGLDQQRARCEWLQRQCLLLHKVSAWHERLANSLPDDAFVIKDALVDITPAIQHESSSTSTQNTPEYPRAVADAGTAFLQELASRCKACWSRHMDVRAGHLDVMFDYAAKAKSSMELADDTDLTANEEESLFHFPHFLLSHSRTIDQLSAVLKPGETANTVDQLFQVYTSQVQGVLKRQMTEKANKAKEDLASINSAAGSLRTLTELLDATTEDITRLWILTATVFSQQSPSDQRSSGYPSALLGASFDVSKHVLATLTQFIGDVLSGAFLPLIKSLASKSTRTQIDALQHSLDVLRKFISFYGDPCGPLYLSILPMHDEPELVKFAQVVLAVLEEQQPLREAVSLTLKNVKAIVENPSTIGELAVQQIWTEDKDASAMAKGMIDLFEMCSVVAVLSRHTSNRTNSEQALSQLLVHVLRAGQEGKGATKAAIGKFVQYLQRKDERAPSGVGSSPNFLLPRLAKAFYASHMPSIVPALLSASSSSSGTSSATKAKAERSLLV